MTLPRFRNRHQQGSEPGTSAPAAAVAMPPSRRARAAARQAESGWPAPWMPWAVGIGLVLAGALIGAFSLQILARKVTVSLGSGVKPAAKSCARPAPGTPNTVALLGPEPVATAAPGEQVDLDWVVKNTGATLWCHDRYRFDPAEAAGQPVFPLPRDLGQAEVTTVHVRVTAPVTPGNWRPGWDLTGPDGKVEGGQVNAQIYVSTGAGP